MGRRQTERYQSEAAYQKLVLFCDLREGHESELSSNCPLGGHRPPSPAQPRLSASSLSLRALSQALCQVDGQRWSANISLSSGLKVSSTHNHAPELPRENRLLGSKAADLPGLATAAIPW
jgi:hypothetical protein